MLLLALHTFKIKKQAILTYGLFLFILLHTLRLHLKHLKNGVIMGVVTFKIIFRFQQLLII